MARKTDSAGQRPDSAIAELDERLAASRRLRRRHEQQWVLNLAFFHGNQWMSVDSSGRLYQEVLDAHRAMLVDNRIQPVVLTQIAKMSKTRPVWVGVPRDSSEKEIAAARMRERVFESEWKRLHMVAKRRAGLTWSKVTGSGFLKVTWDGTKGASTEVLVGADNKPVLDSYERPITRKRLQDLPEGFLESTGAAWRRVAMGDADVTVRNPFEMFPDPLASEDGLESAEWIGEEAVYSKAYVYARFPKAQELGIEANTVASGGITEARMAGVQRGVDGYRGIRLREYWSLPGVDGPRGKRCVWTGDGVLLLEEDNPYPWLPYVMFRGTPTPGQFWPDCTVTQLVSPQVQRNKTLSQLADNAERIGNPPLLEPASMAADDFIWHGYPGERVTYPNLGTEDSIPSFMRVPEMPAYVQSLLGVTESSIREISGQHEVTSGQVPAGVTAAAAINLLQEADDTRLGPDIEDMDETLSGLGRRLLWLFRNYASDERLIRIAGTEGAWQILSFRGKDLGDEQADTVQTGSGLPQSKAAKQAALQEVLRMLAQSGLKLDERDLRRVLQEYEVGGLEQFFATIGSNERQVQRENMRLANSEPLEINEYDDDEAHVDGHTEFQKTASYEELPPDVRAGFEEHVAAHRSRLAERAASMAGAAGPAGPPGANGGGPPPPGLLSPA